MYVDILFRYILLRYTYVYLQFEFRQFVVQRFGLRQKIEVRKKQSQLN
jgi:hypothetical protein